MKKADWDSLRYFKPSEFICKCGCGAGTEEMLRDFMIRLENAREIAGIPFRISSGFRCAKHNKFIGVSQILLMFVGWLRTSLPLVHLSGILF